MSEAHKDLLERVDQDRREAVEEMLRTTAYENPVVSSFSMGGSGLLRPGFASNGS